jgi:hypothetical protein
MRSNFSSIILSSVEIFKYFFQYSRQVYGVSGAKYWEYSLLRQRDNIPNRRNLWFRTRSHKTEEPVYRINKHIWSKPDIFSDIWNVQRVWDILETT